MPTFELVTEPYLHQIRHWPVSGRHVLAHFDNQHIVIYQAFRPEIGLFAAKHGYFGDAFSLNRMTWIKTSFLWMMHRSAWATKEGQEVILAIWLTCAAFDAILKKAVFSSFQPQFHESEAEWQRAISVSSVRLQWDPDYNPADSRLERRAIQIGLRGKSAAYYAQGGWIEHIEDITAFVHQQRDVCRPPYHDLILPRQRAYRIYDSGTMKTIGVTEWA